MTLRTGEDILIWRRRLWIALCGGIVLEEALDLSSDRILNEWNMTHFYYFNKYQNLVKPHQQDNCLLKCTYVFKLFCWWSIWTETRSYVCSGIKVLYWKAFIHSFVDDTEYSTGWIRIKLTDQFFNLYRNFLLPGTNCTFTHVSGSLQSLIKHVVMQRYTEEQLLVSTAHS